MTFLDRDLFLLVVAEVELGLHVAAHRLDGAGRQHAFGRAARAHHAVDAKASLQRRLEGAGDVTGGDELDARAYITDLADDLLVAIAVEDDDRQLLDLQTLDLGEPPPAAVHSHLESVHS